MNQILETYKVKLSSPMGYPTHNRFDSVNELLSCFIGDFYSLTEANRLLTGLNSIVERNNDREYAYDTQSMYLAIITSSNTSIYKDMDAYDDNPEIAPDFTLPTSDFQVIVQVWRDYLVSSPTPPNN